MGGLGSGRWSAHSKALTVEECLVLDTCKLARDGLLVRAWGSGSLTWSNTATGEKTASVSWTREPAGEDGVRLRLRYAVGRGDRRREADEPVLLSPTRPPFGGLRWWFTCPLVVNGRPCGRRAGKLYLPPGGLYFGCRVCHRLTYRSAQEHDKRADFYRRNPEAMLAALEGAKAGRINWPAMKAALRWARESP